MHHNSQSVSQSISRGTVEVGNLSGLAALICALTVASLDQRLSTLDAQSQSLIIADALRIGPHRRFAGALARLLARVLEFIPRESHAGALDRLLGLKNEMTRVIRGEMTG